MAIKYTILKVLIRNLSKATNSNKGFTLIELIVGLLIMVIVGGLAMSAFIGASNNFSDDKKNIDSSQNLSAVLEIIGNDVRQSGEQINEAIFPVIKIEVVPVGDVNNKPGSSKITIRRALTSSLTLCQNIAANNAISSNTLIVADNAQTNANCQVGTLSTTSLPPASGNISRPTSLREARNYRCKLDNINEDYTVASTDFCQLPKATVDQEKVLAAMSDQQGNIRTFRYIDDNEVSANTQYTISLEPGSLSASTPVNTGTYFIGSPIYLIEERIYTLGNDGNVKLQIDGGNVETLVKGIESFRVSARVYGEPLLSLLVYCLVREDAMLLLHTIFVISIAQLLMTGKHYKESKSSYRLSMMLLVAARQLVLTILINYLPKLNFFPGMFSLNN
jgi:prepilin-type N-terminal cleavage/methylation domain-containing protein